MEQKENQSTSGSSISNFFTNTPSSNNNNISHPITSQAFPPIENNPQQYQQSQTYKQNNPHTLCFNFLVYSNNFSCSC